MIKRQGGADRWQLSSTSVMNELLPLVLGVGSLLAIKNFPFAGLLTLQITSWERYTFFGGILNPPWRAIPSPKIKHLNRVKKAHKRPKFLFQLEL